jgi:hypothetical protein
MTSRTHVVLILVSLALVGFPAMPVAFPGFSPKDLHAQEDDPERVRFGVTLGGTGFLGLTAEYQWGRQSVEVTLGTFSLRDLSLALSAKQYVGGGRVKAFAGLGLWGIADFGQERTGLALVLRGPVGGDWRVADEHYGGIEIGLNRALAVHRTDPEDRSPPASRIVPLPGIYYRFGDPR